MRAFPAPLIPAEAGTQTPSERDAGIGPLSHALSWVPASAEMSGT